VPAEIGQGQLVDLDHAFPAHRAFPPRHGPGEHAGDVRIGLFGRPGDVAEPRRHRQVRFEPAFVHLARCDGDFGGRRNGWFFLEPGSCHAFVYCRRIGME
jgi:hypothetical protein